MCFDSKCIVYYTDISKKKKGEGRAGDRDILIVIL